MQRPLCVAIAFSLTLAAGCSVKSDRQDADAVDEDSSAELDRVEVSGSRVAGQEVAAPRQVGRAERRVAAEAVADLAMTMPSAPPASFRDPASVYEHANREQYAPLDANPVHRVAESPVSTFSIDVDTGSYANVRRMLNAGTLPPADAVRAEEFLNYFDYGYAPPATTDLPFSVTTEIAPAPWHADRHLMLVGIKGYEVPKARIPASNLVFLVDTSGSMQSPDKIELLRESFKAMAAELRPQDRVAIVAYAGSAGLVLPSTSGSETATIMAALDRLQAGGSTNGGAGIELAYLTAAENFVDGGVNRVILATDGDFNVGTVSVEALKALVADRRESGIALTTLGFGTGNYNDAMAEQLADIGNGNHAYIDTLAEGRKVLVDEVSSTMMTIAKDVKIQVEFNPTVVSEYRLIGYENRVLNREDFDNDKVDAGEIGAGHDVTALYEIVLAGSGDERLPPLRYGSETAAPATARDDSGAAMRDELAFLRLRYKAPGSDTSRLIERPILASQVASSASERLRFAAAVAAFADALRGGTNIGGMSLLDLSMLAESARGTDRDGYRGELVYLIEQARSLKVGGVAVAD